MIDWEQLERELADGEPEAEQTGSARARRRERRQLAVVAVLAVVLLAALLVPVLVVLLHAGPASSPARRGVPARPDTAVPQDPATRAQIYAAALASRPGIVDFGRLVVSGNRARVAVDIVCGADCARGETLALRRAAGRWRVTGTVGPQWIS